MIESVQFKNFKALRDTTLPLSRFTLIVGPNGSGKSTAMQALRVAGDPYNKSLNRFITVGLDSSARVEVVVNWGESFKGAKTILTQTGFITTEGLPAATSSFLLHKALNRIRIYSIDAEAMASPTYLEPKVTLTADGANLAVVLDRLRDEEPEILESLNEELGRWLPEFDRILFETPKTGQRAIALRIQQLSFLRER